MLSLLFSAIAFIANGAWIPVASCAEKPRDLFKQHCFDCHEGADAEGHFDFAAMIDSEGFNATLVFENVATEKMPPSDSEPPSDAERLAMLAWLANQQPESSPIAFRRLSRHEFVHSVNDLLDTNLDLAAEIPEDRGTYSFDSDRRIQLSREVLGSYFAVADKMLEAAFPAEGFPNVQTWVTSKLKDSHETYNIYVRDYQEGVLFSWTRANNGNSYSFFYDNFDPPVSGWYDLTLEAAKVGDFEDDVSVQIHAGKYYYADDRPQPQRLLDVISLGNRDLRKFTTRVFLNPGESVSVHCYSKHNWRQKDPKQGAYIRQLSARGPLQDQWPPSRYGMIFGELPLTTKLQDANVGHAQNQPEGGGVPLTNSGYLSNLRKIGGSISVSSFQPGMGKENMQDGSNRTFWHTRFEPSLASPPHFVVIENPRAAEIHGLSYSTWSGGNGNGQVKKYSILLSDDGRTWSQPITSGELEVRLANSQPISFPEPTTKRFIKFLITDAKTLDGRSLASVGRLDVVIRDDVKIPRSKVTVNSTSPADLKQIIKQFAERAFSTKLSDDELKPYVEVAEAELRENGDFVRATKSGLKAVICSPRFLLAPGEHSSPALSQAAGLSRTLWLSVPDAALLQAATDAGASSMSVPTLRRQIERMLSDERSDRMIGSFCDQWLNLRSWDKVAPSLKLYPTYDDLLHHYLPIETQLFLGHLIRENMPVAHLIDADYSFLNQRLARHYDVEGVVGQHMRKVTFGPEIPRGGLLTMGSVLKVTTDGFETSPILRGAWVSKNIAGTPISPPPESVKAIEPDHEKSAATIREQIEQHKNSPACYACHKSIDPYGFALEGFDAVGQWRDRYRIETPHRNTFQFRLEGYFREVGDIDSSGEIDDRRFHNIFGLKQLLLSNHRTIGYNFAKKFFQFTNGYTPNLKQRLALLAMLDENPDNCRMKDIVTDVLVYSSREMSHE